MTGYLQNNNLITIETNVGNLPISFETRNDELFVRMRQDHPKFVPFLGSIPKLTESMRHFSSPYSGTIEDAVTGTASGVMGAYYLKYLNKEIDEADFVVEQGQEVSRDGRVHVEVKRNESNIEVYISGTRVFIQELEIQYA